MVVSQLQKTKRVLVALLLSLARAYNVTVAVNRDATDTQATAAVRLVAKRVHPDKGGSEEHAKELNVARDDWDKARRAARTKGS